MAGINYLSEICICTSKDLGHARRLAAISTLELIREEAVMNKFKDYPVSMVGLSFLLVIKIFMECCRPAICSPRYC